MVSLGGKKIIVITGPTASGKTGFGLQLAKELDGEIVNADSVQVYKYFNLGSAKPSPEELSEVKHHLISILEPEELFDVGFFVAQAKSAISEIIDRGKTPIVVGGTGLYLQALLCGLAEIENISEGAREILRKKEEEIFALSLTKGELARKLHLWLEEIDPKMAKQILANDLSRNRRAILVKLSTGRSLGDYQEEHRYLERPYDALVFALFPNREKLYQTIDLRVEQMLEMGLLEEIKQLLNCYPSTLKPLQSIGYKQGVAHLSGEISKLEMLQGIKRDTRRYAKRQYTWWRNQPKKLGWNDLTQEFISICQGDEATFGFRAAKQLILKFFEYNQELFKDPVSFVLIRTMA